MKNSVIKYDRTDFYDGYSVTDYTSRKLGQIYDLDVLQDDSYVRYYNLTDNETIEQVSYAVYGTPMYWDVILLINRSDPLFSMVYDFDFSRETAEEFIDAYHNTIYSGNQLDVPQPLPTTYLDLLKDMKTEEFEALKETRRVIKVVRHNKILDFMKLLRQTETI